MKLPIKLLNGSANAVVRALGIEPQEELRSARSSDELASLAGRSASEGKLDSETAHLVQRSVAFGPRTAGEIMTPRVQMACVDSSDPVTEVIELSSATGYSKFPVIKGSTDNIVGSVHVKQAVAVPRSERASTQVREIMVDATVVPESLRLDPLLQLLRGRGVPDGDRLRRVRRHGRRGHPRGRGRGDRGRHRRRARPLRLPAAAASRRQLDRLRAAPARRGASTRPGWPCPSTRTTTPWPACWSGSSAGSPSGATRSTCRCRS